MWGSLIYIQLLTNHISIRFFIDPNIPRQLMGDFHRLKQIILNLVSNAIKYTPDGGKITIGGHFPVETVL